MSQQLINMPQNNELTMRRIAKDFEGQRELEDDQELCVLYNNDKYIIIDKERMLNQFSNEDEEILIRISTLLHEIELENEQPVSQGMNFLWEIMNNLLVSIKEKYKK